ncbi:MULTISPECIES: hypothetical protein [Niastella]|uniref:CHRD domain-containing protein n=1 Tax=Niastella soli TaxID=2821487 RepID=A0ABS3YQV6_9BACT|nr:hypothetical protein [Niastella soli]MBO9200214.1 hypothetical protein [Niastella soli]
MKKPIRTPLTNRLHISVTCLLLFQLLNPYQGNGQLVAFKPVAKDTSASRIRNIIFTTPVAKNTTINGLAIGLMPITWYPEQTLNINGVSISASPIDPFLAIYLLAFTIPNSGGTVEKDLNNRHFYLDSNTSNGKYNGLLVGSYTPMVTCNGINITALMNSATKMNGLSVAGLFNRHYSFKGVLIAGIRNKTTRGKGLQIGLLNRCQDGKLVQIGLLNRIGKRTIPFINLKF